MNRYLNNINDADFVKLIIENKTIRGLVNIDGIYCDDNVQTSQFTGSPISVSERGSRGIYSFSVNITVIDTDQHSLEKQIKDILELRALNKPLKLEFPTLNKYSIKKMNIIDYTAEEYENYAEITLSCEEVIEYDIEHIEYTDEQSYMNDEKNDTIDLTNWLEEVRKV